MRTFALFLALGVLTAGCSSSDDSSTAASASPSQVAIFQPSPISTQNVESDDALVSRLEAKANDALSTYVSLHDEATNLAAGAPVDGGDTAMAQYTGNDVRPWRERERQFQYDITTNVPTIPSLTNRTGPKSDRARSLVMGVFANLGVADNLMSDAMTDVMASCNETAATLQLKAADEAAHKARLTLDRNLSISDDAILAQPPDYIANLDESNKCNSASAGDQSGGGTGADPSSADGGSSGDTAGISQFTTEDAAQSNCPDDTVVWLNLNSGIYHYRGERWYANTENGAFVCEQEAIAAGDRATENGQ